MSRFLFATFGSLGDLHPYVAISRALIERGHTAVIATSEDYRNQVRGAGVEFATAGPGLEELGDYRTLVTRMFDVRQGPEYLFRSMIMPYLRPTYHQLLQAADGADLLVSHPLAVTLQLVAQRSKVPWVSTVLAPMNFFSCYDPPLLAAAPFLPRLRTTFGLTPLRLFFTLVKLGVRRWEEPLREFRAELGLPPTERQVVFEGQFSPFRTLALFDSILAQPQPDWPANTRICNTPVFDGVPEENGMLTELAEFLAAGEPPVVFALGSSVVWIAEDFWDKAAEAVRLLGRRAILITGPAMPTSLPETVRAFPYVPYSVLFPAAAAIVHQAGAGTLAQALRAGRPQLFLPVAFDQPDNARRAAGLGLGRIVPFRKITPRRLAEELAKLLDNPGYADATRAVSRDLARTDGAARAADELIACLAG
jgi:rhamnosyltransferase subunit B